MSNMASTSRLLREWKSFILKEMSEFMHTSQYLVLSTFLAAYYIQINLKPPA